MSKRVDARGLSALRAARLEKPFRIGTPSSRVPRRPEALPRLSAWDGASPTVVLAPAPGWSLASLRWPHALRARRACARASPAMTTTSRKTTARVRDAWAHFEGAYTCAVEAGSAPNRASAITFPIELVTSSRTHQCSRTDRRSLSRTAARASTLCVRLPARVREAPRLRPRFRDGPYAELPVAVEDRAPLFADDPPPAGKPLSFRAGVRLWEAAGAPPRARLALFPTATAASCFVVTLSAPQSTCLYVLRRSRMTSINRKDQTAEQR